MKKLSMVLCLLAVGALLAFVGCDDSDSTPKVTGPVNVSTTVEKTITPTADGTITTAQVIDSSTGTGTAATKVIVTIPAGTQVLKADGTPVTNPIKVIVVASDPNSEATFENKSFNFKDQNNQSGTFVSAGHFSITVLAGDQVVDTITQPIEVALVPKPGHTYTEGQEFDVVVWASPLYRLSCKAKFTNGKFVIKIKKGKAYGCSFVNNILEILVINFKFNIGFGTIKPATT